MSRNVAFFISLSLLVLAVVLFNIRFKKEPINSNLGEEGQSLQKEGLHPLSIYYLKKQHLEGSDIILEATISAGINYNQYIASYKSDNLKIYGLLTVPNGEPPKNGFPAIIFNHGYIPPKEYKTTERHVAYVNSFASNGYVVFKPDYRGHGESEGEVVGAYGSNDYTIDVLNALASIKRYKKVNPDKIGMWGHSMGGFIALRSLVVNHDIKAAVIWSGVVASYDDLIYNWRRGTFTPPPTVSQNARRWRDLLIQKYGSPSANPKFWSSLSANSYLSEITTPIQLHHGTTDKSVPIQFSQKLYDQLKDLNKEVEFYKYEGDDHNISRLFNLAMQRSIEFFNKYLK